MGPIRLLVEESFVHRMTLRGAINSKQIIHRPEANGVTDGSTNREMQVQRHS